MINVKWFRSLTMCIKQFFKQIIVKKKRDRERVWCSSHIDVRLSRYLFNRSLLLPKNVLFIYKSEKDEGKSSGCARFRSPDN